MTRTLITALALLAALVEVACLEPESSLSGPAAQHIVGVPGLEGEQPRGVYVMTELVDEAPPARSDYMFAGATIIYMNRMGGTYTPGYNDARTNRSTIPSFTSTISPWAVSDAGWSQVMSCVTDIFSPFNVIITDEDPGNVPHFESVVAGWPGDVGMGSGVGGVSPFTYDCSVIPNSIVFTFAEVYGSNYQEVCHTVAQEVAHSFGLDHEYLCADPMTYLGGCGAKTFQNTNASCGEYSARTCACGGSTQNSVAMLADRLGPADASPPTVSITQPANGATVAPGFAISATASDDAGVYSVALYIDGALVETRTAAPYSFTAPIGLSDGTHVIATVASDGMNETTAQIQVTVQSATDPDPDPDPDPPPPDEPADPDEPNGGPDEPGDPDDPAQPDEPADPDDPTYAGDLAGGCNAAAGGGPGGAALLFWLLIGGRRRPRRR